MQLCSWPSSFAEIACGDRRFIGTQGRDRRGTTHATSGWQQEFGLGDLEMMGGIKAAGIGPRSALTCGGPADAPESAPSPWFARAGGSSFMRVPGLWRAVLRLRTLHVAGSPSPSARPSARRNLLPRP